eukprot:scaffold628134_cov52-Prasinocladus_malaysianus.AAC.2
MPGGICTIDSRLSYGTLPPHGTPMTGLHVMEAMTPGRAAATPAMPIKTCKGRVGSNVSPTNAPKGPIYTLHKSGCHSILWSVQSN